MASGSILFTPFAIGNITLRNRITMAPTYLGYGNTDGTVSDLILEHYRRMAGSGASLIVVENTGIHPYGLGSPNMLRIDDDRYLEGLTKLAKIIHAEGSFAFLQLNHAGRFAYPSEKMAPSPVPVGNAMPKEMSETDIENVIKCFAEAATRTRTAGFDGLDLHGGTGYLLSQFVSPRTNKRLDAFGGDLQKRMLFPLKVVDAVMGAAGRDFPVGYRFLADECLPDGLKIDEAIIFAEHLAKRGIAYLSVMIGTHESFPLEPYVSMERNEGYMADHAAIIKKAIPGIPIITAGRIQSRKIAEEILEAGKADLIGLARVLFADPLWPKKVEGSIGIPIVPCNPSCSLCMRRVMARKPPLCSQWDKATREAFLKKIGEKETAL